MKILFAVSNENVSKKIVESYQKKYGETVSYKNVFYFNAIIREIHKDKTYDRIVISEDLEPFSNNNYDVIDKFILERFKEISNELSSQDRFVDITVICTDRRTKAGYVLSKMYDYGIYNALIGKDRRIDNVCTLLNNPRTAQEAETYYELKNQVDTSSVDDVSEQEVQNILIHYKRLGRNEERYVDSFNNIASQYTDKQLKIIIKCLPINVRAVLEAECPKYQELVTYADESEEERKKKIKLQEQKRIEQLEQEKRLKQKLEKEKRENARNAQRINQEQERMQRQQQTTSGIDLLDNKRKEQRMTGNVIIPGNMDIRNERKVYTDEEINNLQQRSARPVQERQTADTLPGLDEFDSIPQPKPVQQQASTLPGLDEFDSIPQQRATQQPASTLPGLDEFDNMQQQRPTQQPASTLPGLDEFDNMQQQRPTQQPASTLPGLDEFDNMQQQRPTQQPASTLPGLDEFDSIPQQRATQQPANTLPGLDEFDSIPQQRPTQQPASTLPGLDEFDSIPQQRPTQQPANTLPGLDEFDSIPQQRPTQQPANTLPGLDEFDSIPQQRATQQQAHTLPGLDEIDSIAGVNKTQQPLKQKSENSTQMQMEAVASQPEISQQPKRGRGRPRKNPIEPPKPKGKRGRPRKNPLPEESENKNEKEKILPGINDFENIPQLDNIQRTETSVTQNMPVKAEKNLPKVTENKTELPKTVENQQNIQQPASTLPGTNDWDKEPFEPVNTQQSASTLPGTNDWDKEPFEPVNTQQSASTLPGTNDWDKEPFEPVNTQQSASTLPGTNDWDKEPFEPVNTQQSASTLPGTNDWDKDPFEPVNTQQPASTLPGTNDWDKDPFEPVNTQQPASTLPGTNDWDKDPFEPVNTQQPASTLPGTNDWDKDPFEPVNTQPKPNTTSSSNNWNDDPFELNPKSQETLSSTQMNPQLNNSQQYQEIPNNKKAEKVAPYAPSPEKAETLQKIEENRIYTTGSLNSILTKDKKIVAFVGASKSGTSFLINNLGCLFSSIGIKTAILDMTKNKNSYYIYTNNDEKLRNIAYTSIENLEKGIAEGINIDRNLSVYTTVPNDGKDYSNGETILSTLIQNESLVLIDCDFETDPSYFANAQEIYLVQSMDILTIQPLTAFLRELKTMGILDPEKLRIVINKEIKVKNLTSKAIIGGMSFYNDPAMSYMTELFNKEKIRACTIPFDENVYSKYLEEVVNCVITINGYSKNFMNNLKLLGNMVYPLLSKQTYSSKNTVESNYGNNFSTEMNNTLNQMKNKY